MPTAVLRRYTPPTCTLEIAATGSALSRWTDRTVLKNVRFNLSFDDPKLLPEQQITISGNRTQLEALHQAVGGYVQQLLHTAPDQIRWEPALQLEQTGEVGARLPSAATSHAAEQNMPAELALPSEKGIALHPKGLLTHELQLGDLATVESGSVVQLTALQLFDLANALEEYQAEALSLPTLERSWLKLPQGSLKIAASAVLALGITGVLSKFVIDLSRPTVQQTATAPAEREVNSELSQELFPTLSPPPLGASPPVTLQPLPPPPPNGAAPSNEPGLPPVGVTQPPAAAPQPQAPAANPEALSGEAPVAVIPNPDGAAIPAVPPASVEAPSISAEPPRLAGVDSASSALRSGQAFDSAESVNPESNVTTSSTAFDTIPQVAEIRGYFQERWQPPAELTQTLEYRLLLSADGSLQRIVPLGQASANFIDRTNMPLMGEPFVSATSDGSTPQIRLVLKPNGQVQSFLEYAN
ncbi:MAG: DUF4335 domain-containing protein [Cyanobacteria bacterium RM1_2_2]|nr:DUF4335 domain-containing protein [Cyanobacteria bacterium RM1_2_2]